LRIQGFSQRMSFSSSSVSITRLPSGMTALGIFLLFGSVMASLAGASLVWPEKILVRMWEANPRAYNQLAPYGKTVGILFVLLGITLALSGVGWFKRRLWGWRLVVIIIVTQVLASFVTALMGGVTRGLVGAIISGALLFYLLRPAVRATFSTSEEPPLFTNSST
jgi:hypothetical protein